MDFLTAIVLVAAVCCEAFLAVKAPLIPKSTRPIALSCHLLFGAALIWTIVNRSVTALGSILLIVLALATFVYVVTKLKTDSPYERMSAEDIAKLCDVTVILAEKRRMNEEP